MHAFFSCKSHTHTSTILNKSPNLNNKILLLIPKAPVVTGCFRLTTLHGVSRIRFPLSAFASRVTITRHCPVSADSHLAAWCIFDYLSVAWAEGCAGGRVTKLNWTECEVQVLCSVLEVTHLLLQAELAFSVHVMSICLQVIMGRSLNILLWGLVDLQLCVGEMVWMLFYVRFLFHFLFQHLWLWSYCTVWLFFQFPKHGYKSKVSKLWRNKDVA